jgi:hypothetical protein
MPKRPAKPIELPDRDDIDPPAPGIGHQPVIVVAAAVPLTLAAVFVIMAATGKDFDRITLGSLILALGLLVDDAIIAIETMVVKMEEGYERMRAAAYAWSHTAAPMLAGTLVTALSLRDVRKPRLRQAAADGLAPEARVRVTQSILLVVADLTDQDQRVARGRETVLSEFRSTGGPRPSGCLRGRRRSGCRSTGTEAAARRRRTSSRSPGSSESP